MGRNWPEQIEGTTRQPLFYMHGNAVLCRDCAHKVIEAGTELERLRAHHYVARLLLCGGCHVYIGPTEAEMQELEESNPTKGGTQ